MNSRIPAVPAVPQSGARARTTPPRRAVLPLGALAAGFGLVGFGPAALAQTEPAAPPSAEARMPEVKVQGEAERTGKDAYQATKTTVGKGQQELRDIPQSVTVVTEKLMDDKNHDTLKSALHSVTGVAFEAGEGGAIGDLIRLRGFSTRGDIFQDGLRDIAQYNRDTYNLDRVEVLRGSASMLYGRGSTGGIVNQVSKQPFGLTQHVVDLTVGTDNYVRLTGDFNLRTGDDAALRVNVMNTDAHSFRNGPETHRLGLAPTYRWGIGTRDEFSVGFYHLSYDDVPDYGFRWLNRRPVEAATERWYGFDSDYQKDSANHAFLTHLHRFADGGELKTTLREGRYKRDLWATTAGFAAVPDPTSGLAIACSYPQGTPTTPITSIEADSLICRGGPTRAAEDTHRFVQTDYSGRAGLFGLQHSLLAGAEFAHEQTTTYSYSGTPPKPPTTWGSPGPGPDAALADTRVRARNTEFTAKTIGAYLQDTLQLAAHWKLIAGLRYDHFSGDYERASGGPLSRTDSLWSHRLGALWQPDAQTTWYASYGTSFNASGDLYQFDDRSANTPPEKSRNVEAGAKWDLADGDLSLRAAIFRTEKYNERNTDVDQAADAYLLSGRRHTDGVEFEAAGRPTAAIEVFGGVAYQRGRIDEAGSSEASQRSVGRESGLTPRWTGNLWVTVRVAPKWRVGVGADGMSSRVPALAEAGDMTGLVNRAPGYVKADALVEYDDGPWRVRLNLINLFDKLYADGLYRGFTVPGPTRAAQLTLSSTF